MLNSPVIKISLYFVYLLYKLKAKSKALVFLQCSALARGQKSIIQGLLEHLLREGANWVQYFHYENIEIEISNFTIN